MFLSYQTGYFSSPPLLMDCLGSPKTSSLPSVVKSPRPASHASIVNLGFPSSPRGGNLQCQNLLKFFGTPESGRRIYARRRSQPLFLAVANTETKTFKYNDVRSPLEPSSPEGKLLSCILQNHRHFFQYAMSEQLDELVSNRDGTAADEKQNSGSMESLLHRRIAEMKEKNRQIAVEDVMYMSIVHKFSEVEVPMVPKLTKCSSNKALEICPSKCNELESIHSLEFQEMIRAHLSSVLCMRRKSGAMDGVTKIDKLHLGRIYAASILYGYFLKSASFRRELEMTLAPTQRNIQPHEHDTNLSVAGLYQNGFGSPTTFCQSTDAQTAVLCQEPRSGTNDERLSTYVKGFDSESLQRCAKLKSKAAVNVIEKHTWALFGDEQIGQHDSDNNIAITLPTLERLVLEAVTFGSFLWDVERSVDSVYGLKEN